MMKRFLFALLMFSGVTRLIALLNRRRVTILCYHSVTAHASPILDDPHKLHTPVSSFVKQLEYLRRFHNVISLDEFLEAAREHRELPDHSVVLTFEDGVRNFLTVAAPQLKRMSMPATNFIITGLTSLAVRPNANHKWQPADDQTFLSWPDVDELVQAIHMVAGHEVALPPTFAALVMERVADLAALCHQLGGQLDRSFNERALTRREREILKLMAKGYGNREIAEQLTIQLGTAKNHVHNILDKLCVSSRRDAAACWSLAANQL